MIHYDVFMTEGRVTIEVEAVDTALAEYVGCPTATHRLNSRHGSIYGTFEVAGTGREVKVPGWPTRKGLRVRFVPAVVTNTSPVYTGWVG